MPKLTIEDMRSNIQTTKSDIVWSDRGTPDHYAIMYGSRTNISVNSTGGLCFAEGATFDHYARIEDRTTDIPLTSNGSIIDRTRFYSEIDPYNNIAFSPIAWGSCTSIIDATDDLTVAYNVTADCVSTVTDICCGEWVTPSADRQPSYVVGEYFQFDNHTADERFDRTTYLGDGQGGDFSAFVVFSVPNTLASFTSVLKNTSKTGSIIALTNVPTFRNSSLKQNVSAPNSVTIGGARNYGWVLHQGATQLNSINLNGGTTATNSTAWDFSGSPTASSYGYEIETSNNTGAPLRIHYMATFNRYIGATAASQFTEELKRKFGDA